MFWKLVAAIVIDFAHIFQKLELRCCCSWCFDCSSLPLCAAGRNNNGSSTIIPVVLFFLSFSYTNAPTTQCLLLALGFCNHTPSLCKRLRMKILRLEVTFK